MCANGTRTPVRQRPLYVLLTVKALPHAEGSLAQSQISPSFGMKIMISGPFFNCQPRTGYNSGLLAARSICHLPKKKKSCTCGTMSWFSPFCTNVTVPQYGQQCITCRSVLTAGSTAVLCESKPFRTCTHTHTVTHAKPAAPFSPLSAVGLHSSTPVHLWQREEIKKTQEDNRPLHRVRTQSHNMNFLLRGREKNLLPLFSHTKVSESPVSWW